MKQFTYSRPSENIAGYELSKLAKYETNDCVVLAMSSSLGIPYEDAHKFVSEKFGRKPRKGTPDFIYKMDQSAYKKEVIFNKKVKRVNTRVMDWKLSKFKPITVNKFILNNMGGTYIVVVRGHAFTIKNGVVIGNPEDSTQIKKRILAAYEVINE